MSSVSSSTAATTLPTGIYKGKVHTRSWPQLPPEIIRWIATFFLLDSYATMPIPDTWRASDLWESRMVYTTVRASHLLENLIHTCPQWRIALEKHTFWDQACLQLDPYGSFDKFRIVLRPGSSAPPTRTTSFRHYCSLLSSICLVCRINRPASQCLPIPTNFIRESIVHYFGRIIMCRTHKRSTFCGACLRETGSVDPRLLQDDLNDVMLAPNEDIFYFKGLVATCRCCRSQELWRHMSQLSGDREACGGGPQHGWNAPDPETRQTIELFIDTGEGSIPDVATIAREKYWLLRNTRVSEYLEEAVAAHRLTERMENPELYGAHALGDELSEELDPEEFEDLTIPEHLAQAREMAISAWARTRVLEGHWVTPFDEWYEQNWRAVRAEHPAPWMFTEDAHGMSDEHPPAHLRIGRPPTYSLVESLFHVFMATMRKILAPALANVVRRVALTTADPALYAARMEMQDVLHELRQPYAWSKTLDVQPLPPLPPMRRPAYKDGAVASSGKDDSSSHTGSETEATSPVLSASTLQTTPSPPPPPKPEVMGQEQESTPLSPAEIDGGPPPDPANMLHAIPYIPISYARMPVGAKSLLQQLWREQCSPLYQCNCGICTRALRVQYSPTGQPNTLPSQPAFITPPSQIQLSEARYTATAEEEEEDEELSDDDDDDGEEYAAWGEGEYEAERDDVPVGEPIILQPAPVFVPQAQAHTEEQAQPQLLVPTQDTVNKNGKRAMRDYEQEEEEQATDEVESTNVTPPKRTKLTGDFALTTMGALPPRLAKRRSEDVTEESERKRGEERKRARVEGDIDASSALGVKATGQVARALPAGETEL